MKLRILAAILPVIAVSAFASLGFDDYVAQGRAAFLASDPVRAESAYNQACPADLVSTYPVPRVVTCENLLATVDEARGNLASAEQRYLHAVADADQAGPAYQPLYCAKLIDLGEYYHRRGRTSEAESSLLKALELARNFTAVKPELLPEALNRLGGLYANSAQPERGRAPLNEAIAMLTASAGIQPSPAMTGELAHALDALGMIEIAAGHQREAESNLRQAVALATSAFGEDHPVIARYETNLALVLMLEGRFSNADLLLRRAQLVVESRQGPSASGLGVIYAEMSTAASAQGKLMQAVEFAQRAITVLKAQPVPDKKAIAMAEVTLGNAYLHGHKTAEAETILPDAVQAERRLVTNPNAVAAAIQSLAQLREQQHDSRAAEALYREAIGIYESDAASSPSPFLAPALRALATLLKHNGGSKIEVRALETRARDVLESASSAKPANPRA